MKALVYNGPRDVTVKEVPDPRIERPTDVLVKITRTNICGSDLHMYEGRTDMESGRVLGHENMGEVVEVGSGVDRLNVGDMVAVPFNVACGHCKNCERGLTNYCITAQPQEGFAGGVLAAREGVTQPAMTQLISRLEESGLVRREPSPDDGRVVLVVITEQGLATLAHRRSARAERLAGVIAQLSPDHRAALAAALPALDALASVPREDDPARAMTR